MKSSYLTATDQFCGAGGSSIGATLAGITIRLAMNHWELAIKTHNTNFPNVDHDCTDISAVNPKRYPSTDILITSPECTNHSLAKGIPRRMYTQDIFGNVFIDPAQERSRATMWDVPRFAEYHEYRIVIVENVVDAAKWRLWDEWLATMHKLDYEHEVVYFNSMFAHPTPQSRDRLYVVFWKKGVPKPNLSFTPAAYCERCVKIVYSIQTWKKPGRKWGRYKAQYFYRCPGCHKEVTPFYYAAFNAIDFSLPATRIGDRPIPLKPKTLARVKYGLDKFGRQPLIVTGRYTSGVECRVKNAAEEPLPTQPGDSSHAIAMPWMVDLSHTKNDHQPVYDSSAPYPTATSAQSVGVAFPYLVETNYSHSGDNRATGADQVLPTQSARQSLGLVGFLSKQYGGFADPDAMNKSLTDPAGTVTTWDHHALIGLGQMPIIVTGREGVEYRVKGVDEPLSTQTAYLNHGLLAAPAFIADMRGGGSMASSGDEPLLCVTATGSHHALLSPQAFLTYYYGTQQASSIGDALHTVTGVDRAGLVQALEGMTVEDLTFRMLKSQEIGRAMAFPVNYKVLGTERERTKQYGNGVTPPFYTMLMERCAEALA
jgi:DNA (cytosine-5)-methyltransferase 1